MNPETLLVSEDGQDVIRVGGYLLPAEDFDLARFLRDDLGTTWLHAGGLPSTRRLMDRLQLERGARVADLGCGVGSATRYLARAAGCEVVGLDRDPEMLRRAREATPPAAYPGVSWLQADATSTGLPDGSFDRVLIQSLACFVDKGALFGEVFRLLRPGGLVGINEVTWLQPPGPALERVVCSTICATFHGAMLPGQWCAALERSGLEAVRHEVYKFHAATPYQLVREEGMLSTLGILWRVMTRAELNMRLGAVGELFRNCPDHFGYGLYVARKPA